LAALLLANEGKSTIVGEGVEYIFTNARHTNPLCRVTPKALIKETPQGQDFDYDKKNIVTCLTVSFVVLRHRIPC
jgi:hypothetical protein